ncbi:MAG: BatD family protein [Victivallaceae bacterium]|nr:BatD family protein [Victivallaceae bacterium]
MPKIWLTLLLCTITVISFAEVKLSLEPDAVTVGERFMLWVSVQGRQRAEIAELPEVDGIQWERGSTSSKTQIVNTDMVSSIGYSGIATKSGTLEIPAMKVVLGRKTVLSNPLALKVYPPGQLKVSGSGDGADATAVSLDELAFVRGRRLNGDRSVYIGEDVPVEVELWIDEKLRGSRVSWPELNFNQVSFRDFQSANPENPRFSGYPQQRRAVHDGRRYTVHVFRSVIIPLAAGKIAGSVEAKMRLRIPVQKRRRNTISMWDDDFFDGMFSRAREVDHSVRFDFPDLTVKALPEAPSDAYFLGLLGSWKVEYTTDQQVFRAGNPFTLELKISGNGSSDVLQAPELNLPGFRIYPPEIKRDAGSASIRYAVIPLRAGEATIALNTAVFDLVSEKYQIFKFERKITIDQAQEGVADSGVGQPRIEGAAEQSESVRARDAADKPASNILYLKKISDGGVNLPLYFNNLLWLLILLMIGPLCFLVNEARWLRRERMNSRPALLRRRNALGRRRKILRKLRKAEPEQFNKLVQDEVVPYLNDLLGQPPGTTATELAQKVQNRDLAECLKNSGEAGFMPGTVVPNHDELKKRILRLLKKTVFVWCVLVFATLHGGEMEDAEAAAFNAYDRGDFNAAAEYFRSRLDAQRPNPAILYNLGNALCQSGDLAGSLVCYEKAHLLAPRDNDIIENLNFVRRQLMQPEVGQIRNPYDLLIHIVEMFRPDQWLLVAAAAWSCLWLLATLRRRLGFNRKVFSLLLLLFIFFLALAACSFQFGGKYSGKTAVVMRDATPLLSLPSESSGKIERTIPAGMKVKIIELRRDWVRVRLDRFEGWMKTDGIQALKL